MDGMQLPRMISDQDLDQLPETVLIDALKRRSDAGCIVTTKGFTPEDSPLGQTSWAFGHWAWGNPFAVTSLLAKGLEWADEHLECPSLQGSE